MRLLNLAQVLREGNDLRVYDEPGWKTRGSEDFGPLVGMTIHETRGSINSTTRGEINVLLHGSATAPPPIAPLLLLLARNGDWHVTASGRCNHNLVGWAGPNKGYGNKNLLGIEAVHALGLTDVVAYDGEGRADSVMYDRLTIGLLVMVGELRAEVETLKAQLQPNAGVADLE